LLKVKKGVPMKMDANQHPTFEEWLAAIDELLWRGGTGLAHHNDLPDQPWRDWYDERLRPIRAANRALKREGADRF